MKKNPRFLSSVLVALCFLVPQKTKGMELVENVYSPDVTYSPGRFDYHREETTFSTLPVRAQEPYEQKCFIYGKVPQKLGREERVLKKISPDRDGRVRVLETARWPHNICTQIDMTFNGQLYGGSGCLVGPHHVLTCGHNVYDREERKWAERISVHPALNDSNAPFGEIQVVKAITFKGWILEGKPMLDMALLILNKSIGKYTGWGGLLSDSDNEAKLLRERVHITGYPGDKGSKQMWSMSHTIKVVKPEEFEYEIDTSGGQSGSPIWINRYGVPMVLGVHTLGHDLINSGVRLSVKKFTDFVGIISQTYVLNSLVAPPVVIPVVPIIAQGYEEVYRRFLKGVLVYRPQEGSDAGRIDMPIAALTNPLEGTFDLSRCGDTAQYLSIATGYRKGIKAENKDKVEIWFAPRFLIQRELATTAGHFREIEGKWAAEAAVGMFWTWGNWDNMEWYDYLVSQNMENLSKINLYENWHKSWWHARVGGEQWSDHGTGKKFQFCFLT
jgi:V8-like Glu-specific endopeptidase